MPALTAALAALAVALGAAAGCYRPSIEDRGFLCNPEGKACPDGFACVQGRCTHGSAPGVDSGTCTLQTPPPACAEPARDGQACNPTCQTGCVCGRCNVEHGNAVCGAPGPKTLGQKCNPAADDCAAGFICLAEMCGNLLARCYQHCTENAQCTGGGRCQIPILNSDKTDTGYKVCDLAPQSCDPFSLASSGCPDPALQCYLTSDGQTLCDCPNRTQGPGADCALYNDCGSGLSCVKVSGVSRCYGTCDQSAPICNDCAAIGDKYGYCP